MAGLLTYLEQRSEEDWLVGQDSWQFWQMTVQFFHRFQEFSRDLKSAKVLLAEPDPCQFLAAFLGAIAANCTLFLANPQWQQQEWEQVYSLVSPDLLVGNCPAAGKGETSSNSPAFPAIMIPTGGSSGKIRFAIHTWKTLSASVGGFQQYFAVNSINSFCVLPLHHVGGLLQFMRSFLTQGKLAILPYQSLKQGEKPILNYRDFFISLVPTQLQFILEWDPEWLGQFQAVLLGGGPAWPDLLEAARKHKIRLSPTYGMTETASQIATLKPEDFLKGYQNSGRILPHAKIKIDSVRVEEKGGQGDGDKFLNEIMGFSPSASPACFKESTRSGIIAIESASLFRGYYPDFSPKSQLFLTDDLGFIDGEGYLHILGRHSQKIITGGENVFPAEVEAAILATKLVRDVAVIGLPDRQWGEVVTAIYVPESSEIAAAAIEQAIRDKISKFKQPKLWLAVKSLPRNQLGKLNYQKLLSSLKSLLYPPPELDFEGTETDNI